MEQRLLTMDGPEPVASWVVQWQAALVVAEQFLADTAEAVRPGLSAQELLGHLVSYRTHLSALAVACRCPQADAMAAHACRSVSDDDRGRHALRHAAARHLRRYSRSGDQ